MVKRISIFPLAFLVLILVFPKLVYSHHQAQVLGVSTSSAIPQIPPTAEGPGLILPDSPFFFLDEIKQNIRLLLAFTPQERAKVHGAIAGERLAELRLMLARQNNNGIETDLKGVAENLQKASEDLETAQLMGKDVLQLAQLINENIKSKQDTLDVLEDQSAGELHAMVLGAQTSILKSKLRVEDSLPKTQIENEIRDDLYRQLAKKVKYASSSSYELMLQIEELRRQASEAAKRSLKNREDALKKAIEKKNDVLKKQYEKLLELEKKKQEKLLHLQDKAALQAGETVRKAQEAAFNYQKLQQEVNKLRTAPVTQFDTTTATKN